MIKLNWQQVNCARCYILQIWKWWLAIPEIELHGNWSTLCSLNIITQQANQLIN